MPTLDNHPSALNPLGITDNEEDYSNLVNTVERHTRCNAAYSLCKKAGQTQVKC